MGAVAGVDAAVQEGTRRVRRRDDPVNSALGGAAAGALLFASHGAAAPRGAVICAAIGAAAHWTSDALSWDRATRGTLISMGLLDPTALPARPLPHKMSTEGNTSVDDGDKLDAKTEERVGFWEKIRPYLPIRKMTDAEYDEHVKKKAREEAVRLAQIQAFTTIADGGGLDKAGNGGEEIRLQEKKA